MGTYNTLLPLAMLTIMMFLIWSDSIRKHRSHPVAYGVRALLFLAGVAILLYNRFRYPHLFSGMSTLLIAVVSTVGLGGAVYFGRKLLR